MYTSYQSTLGNYFEKKRKKDCRQGKEENRDNEREKKKQRQISLHTLIDSSLMGRVGEGVERWRNKKRKRGGGRETERKTDRQRHRHRAKQSVCV